MSPGCWGLQVKLSKVWQGDWDSNQPDGGSRNRQLMQLKVRSWNPRNGFESRNLKGIFKIPNATWVWIKIGYLNK